MINFFFYVIVESNMKQNLYSKIKMLFFICIFLIFNISINEAQVQMDSGFFNSGRFRVNWTDFQTYTQFELRTDITDINNLYTAIGFSRDRSMVINIYFLKFK